MALADIIYLASPYTHPDAAIREQRYNWAMDAVAWLLRGQNRVYSPIVHFHHLAALYELPQDAEFWKQQNRSMLQHCATLYFLEIPGSHQSVGMRMESEWAEELKLPVRRMVPGVINAHLMYNIIDR